MIIPQAILLATVLIAQNPSSNDTIQDLLRTKEACNILSDLFEGQPQKDRIQRSLDNVMRAYDLPVTEENRLRAGSVLIAFRKKEGAREIHFLEYMERHAKSGSGLSFPEAAAVFLVVGRYEVCG